MGLTMDLEIRTPSLELKQMWLWICCARNKLCVAQNVGTCSEKKPKGMIVSATEVAPGACIGRVGCRTIFYSSTNIFKRSG